MHIHIFRNSFSSGPAAILLALKVQLMEDERPGQAVLWNYLQVEKDILRDFSNQLVGNSMGYHNLTSRWASTPLLYQRQVQSSGSKLTCP